MRAASSRRRSPAATFGLEQDSYRARRAGCQDGGERRKRQSPFVREAPVCRETAFSAHDKPVIRRP